ncbi:biotin-dependent carboxyltransferase family protein [Allosediminivita pacifica]|uniref:Allophanate hydrolase n=1 Tax=Allosediminivita pacifica TaxID=1267769 RepID=A0A2T6ANI0_9RHOB|nr:biotin-dependent carboxyltransferase family protein [Allosediminivita pacifica]PTX45373.1 allophanate hydrolase [Allosediminivita pacifica]GGB20762.1 allophanate hydrolase [Allosediminivita pacifica]
MSLEVLSCGPMLSVQDQGRLGHKRFGVPAAGAMDRPAMDFANALCANAPGAATLEFTGFGGSFRAGRDLRLAVTGGACDVRFGDRVMPAGQSHAVKAGEVVKIGALEGATWGYVAVSGGIAVPEMLGGRATHLRFAIGGLEGRALAAGDVLPLGEDDPGQPCLRPRVPVYRPGAIAPGTPVRVVPGPQDDYFDPEVLDRLTSGIFEVTRQRDRMAMVLDGPDLPAAGGHDIVSDGIVPGAIQAPASGRAVVLMADAQTTGGYPKIATVLSCDLPRLAQMPTGTELRFEIVGRDAAEEIVLEERARVAEVLGGLVPDVAGALSSEFLLACDLVGGIVAPEEVMGHDLAEDHQ